MPMSRLKALALVLPYVALAAGSAGANDSAAVLEAGGLRLTRDAPVELLEEELAISADAVRVEYRFRAADGAGVSTLVAFPLPEFDFAWLGASPVAVDAGRIEDAVQFRLWVNGRPAATRTEARAFRNGIDLTDLLTGAGLPYRSLDGAEIAQALIGLAPPERAALADVDAARWEQGQAWPLWTTRVAYYWKQHFPPDRDVHIRHTYRPIAGRFVIADPELRDVDRRQFCIGDAEAAGLRRRLAQTAGGALLGVHVRYVLTTAAHWRGPIGRFRLTVDKGAPEALVSLCFDGLKKVAPTAFASEISNFTPTRDLDVLFVQSIAP